MAKFYRYVVVTDSGAAPNPFGGVLTLAICKPRIRVAAPPKGDWVLGFAAACWGDLRRRLVYAMQVDEVFTFQEYNQRCEDEWTVKVPDVESSNLEKRVGDCQYYYVDGEARQRPGPHGPDQKEKDLGGKHVLAGARFYYFGANAVALPDAFSGAVREGIGHSIDENPDYADGLLAWLDGEFGCGVHGKPFHWKEGGGGC